MLLTPDHAICSQRLAQKMLSSSNMLPPSLKPLLLRLQQETNVDFSRLIQLSDYVLTFMSGQTHQKIKRCLAKSLGSKNLQCYEPIMHEAGLFLVKSLQSVSGPIDIVRDIEEPLYLYVVKEIFGYRPISDEGLLKSVDIAVRLSEPLQSIKILIEVQRVFDQLTKEISEQLNIANDCSLMHDISQGLESQAIGAHSREQVATIVVTLIVATRTTFETLSNMLIENSRLNWVERERFSNEGWVKTNMNELIRFCASTAYLTRTAGRDMQVEGFEIAKGDDILVHIPSSNRDSSYFDNCEYAKLNGKSTRHHLSFGAGIHRCPGAHLAIMILSHVLPSLYLQFPELRVDLDKLYYKSTQAATRLRSAPVTLY